MIPNFTIFGKTFGIYPILALVGFFAAGIFACYRFHKRGKNEDDMISFFLIMTIGVLVGAHFLYGITNFPYMIRLFTKIPNYDSIGQFFEAAIFVFGGAVFYGGLLGGLLVGYIYIKKKKLDFALYTDTIAPCIPLFHFFGRMGCFLAGCCYGVESEFGFVYHHSEAPYANGVSRFPVQLVEVLCNLIIFLLIMYLEKKGKCKGSLLLIYLTIYPVVRFVDEFFRGDTYRGFLLGLSTSQWISILILVGVSISLIRRKMATKQA